MKVSREEKQKTHRRIVEAAVEVMSARGVRDATMHEIAERAGVGDATIYKYFATKEHLLVAFFELRLEDLIEQLQAIDAFHTYSFREQLQVLFETQLALFTPDRTFLRIAYRNVFFMNWITTSGGALRVRDRFREIIDDLISSAVEVGEFEEPPFKAFLTELIWEHAIGVTYYWLEDESPQHANTTQMIDKSLAVFEAVLKSRILSTVVDLAQFFIREHVLSKFQMTGARDSISLSEKRPFLSRETPEREPVRKTSPTRRKKATGRVKATQRNVG